MDSDSSKPFDEDEDKFSFNLPEKTTGNYVPYRRGKMDDTEENRDILEAHRCVANRTKSLEESGKISLNGSSSQTAAPVFESCDAIALKSCEVNPP
jgi:hypothetical protein